MKRRSLVAVTVIALYVAACGGDDGDGLPVTPAPSPVTPTPATAPTTTAAGPVVDTSTSTTSSLPQATSSSTTSSTVAPGVPQPALPEIAVGPDGIAYRGTGAEQEIVGPSLLGVDPGGGFHIHDPVGMRILSFADAGNHEIDLPALDILAVTAMAAGPEHLVVVETFFSPVRHRAHRVGYDGTLLETIELPPGYRLEDGLSGVLTGSGGEIILEFRGGARYGVWDPAVMRFETVTTLSHEGTTIAAVGPDLEINGTLVATELTGFGGSRYLGTAADGTVVTVRDDVVATSPVFRVLTTVEWYDRNAEFLGSARVPPLEEQYTDQAPGVALGTEGTVYVLIAREDVVRVEALERLPRRITELPDGG